LITESFDYCRLNEDNSWSNVWKNNHIASTLNPRWASAKIPMVTLCNADIDRPLRITIWDWEKSGRHKFMGRVETNVRTLLSNGGPIDVIEPDKKSKSSYKNSGTFVASNCIIEHNPTFSDVSF
jgi:copine 1/2/3